MEKTEGEVNLIVKLVLTAVLGGCIGLILHLYNVLVGKPKKLRSKLQSQGIRGPSPSLLVGNIPEIKSIQFQALSAAKSIQNDHFATIDHDWPSTLLPHFKKWRNEYGPTFIYSTGNIQLMCITDIEMVKEISLLTSLSLGKPSYLSKDDGPLVGQGILSSSGSKWAYQRKIIAPELFPERVKDMLKLMVDATTSLVKSWESRIESEGGTANIRVDEDFKSLAADIVSRACFGSKYSKGEEIFSKLTTLLRVMAKRDVGIPGLRYLPSKNNREIWRLEKEIDSMILKVVKERSEAAYEKDLLQMILEGAKTCGDNDEGFSKDRFIIDNCKNIYFAGHETTAITSSWCLLLLAAHPDWQDRVRAEVLETCKDGLPDGDTLRKMKMLTMVIQETLRLYPPAAYVTRQALEDIEFTGIVIPKGMNIQIPFSMLQQSPELWGSNAHEFCPERFANGIRGACKTPHAYMPFGVGPRTCAGQHFAMTELRVILSLLLSRFSFSLSPTYHHSLAHRMVVQSGNGVYLHVNKI